MRAIAPLTNPEVIRTHMDGPTELRTYVFLALAADRNGLGFYGFD